MGGMKDDSVSSTIKTVLLFLIICQNSSAVLLTRYTRVNYDYDLNNMFLVSEIMKLFASIVIEAVTFGREGIKIKDDEESTTLIGNQENVKIGYFAALAESFRIHIWESPKDALKLTLPAILYLLQNFLVYTCISILPVPLYQICQQLKLVTTALLSVMLFNRIYVCIQWFSIFALCIGTAICVVAQVDKGQSNQSQHGTESIIFGLSLILLSNLTSSSAAVYTEAIIKGKGTKASKPNPSVWMRNIQLAFFTICIIGVKMLGTNNEHPFFYDFTPILWIQIVIFAFGGLLIAAVIKYTDSVQKGLASGLSVILSSAISVVIEPNECLSTQFIFGAAIAIGGCFLFANPKYELKQTIFDSSGKGIAVKKILAILVVTVPFLYMMNGSESNICNLPTDWKEQLHFYMHGATHGDKLFALHNSIAALGIESTALDNCPEPYEVQEPIAANKTIVIVYSDLVPTTCVGIGNRVHVRWILSPLHKQRYPLNTVYKQWGEEDLVFNYESSNLPHPENIPPDNILQVTTFPSEGDEFDLSSDLIEQYEREGTAWIMMEGRRHHEHIEYIHETKFPAPHVPFAEPTANDLLRFKYFVSYDPFTIHSFTAAMSGVVSIVFPLVNMTKEEWAEKTFVGEYIKAKGGKIPGIAYGWDDEEILYATKTKSKLRSFLIKAQKWGKDVTVKRFAEDCFRYAAGARELQSGVLVRDSQFEM